MTTATSDLLAAAKELAPSTIALRRQIHQHPELMYEVHQTSELVAAELTKLGLEVRRGVAGTGVIGLLRGDRPGKTVLLRADMDALPITEPGDKPYKSQTPGVMHACGHDAHTAVLLSTARLLAQRKDRLRGAVKFMFQPAEEGGAGALRMMEEGLMEEPHVDAAFALHVDALFYAGEIALRAGPAMAAADRFAITVHGRGGHAARPQLTVDPVVVSAHIVTALQTIISREVSPVEQAVLTIGKIEAGTAFNIIADTATILGTVRSYDPTVQALIQRRIAEVAGGIAAALRARAEIEYIPGYPPLVNHQEGVDLVTAAAREVLGPEAVHDKELEMVAEDFSYLLQQVPGAMFRLGVRDLSWETVRPIHSADFDLSEEALPVGVATMAATALRYLES